MRGFPGVLLAVMLLAAWPAAVCAAQAGQEETEQIGSLLYKYDSMDTAVIRSVDQSAGTVTFCQHMLGRYYTLNADNMSMVYDRDRRPVSTGLLVPGDVADVTFLHQSKHLNSLVVSTTAWTKEDVRNYRIDTEQELMQIDGENFHLPATALLLNGGEGQGERIIAEEILDGDILTVRGIDKEIYSVVVTSGHGYLRLTSTEVDGKDIEGAWLNLDNRYIQRVNARTLVAAPEGTYRMQILGQGANDSRQVTILRGMETVIDSSTIQLLTPETTEILFQIEPEDAEGKLRVDGEPVSPDLPVYLTQGVHQVQLTAEGYLPVSEYIRVGSKRATMRLTLEEDPEAGQASARSSTVTTATTSDTAATSNTAATAGTSDWWNSSAGYAGTGATNAGEGATNNAGAGSGSTTQTTVTVVDISGNETTRTTMPGFEIRVESPEGVEFYMDGNYMGVTPTSFVKVSGQHTVTLAREGYETKSYNIYIDDAQTNKTYAFPELVMAQGDE
ncbi:MAG: PEGA domain-containing protein [Lachnospiraceae bacterium]|nr:PEGA domain-containing protein [Lachnospiraceae bacterium]